MAKYFPIILLTLFSYGNAICQTKTYRYTNADYEIKADFQKCLKVRRKIGSEIYCDYYSARNFFIISYVLNYEVPEECGPQDIYGDIEDLTCYNFKFLDLKTCKWMHSMLNEGVKRGIKECYHGIIDQYIMGNAYVKPDLNIAFRCFTYRRYECAYDLNEAPPAFMDAWNGYIKSTEREYSKYSKKDFDGRPLLEKGSVSYYEMLMKKYPKWQTLFYSMVMANKYNYKPAYYNVYLSFKSFEEFFEVKLHDKTMSLAYDFIKRGANLGDENCKKIAHTISPTK